MTAVNMHRRPAVTLLLFITFAVILHLSTAQLKYDDDVTTRKLHLEDIENEEEQRLLQETQQLPLPPSAGTKYFAPALRKSAPSSSSSQYRNPLYDVDALTARSPPAVYRDFDDAAAQRFRLNLHGSDYNDISAQQQNDDYYADDEPLLQQYRDGAANDGYALKQTPAAYVLVPPFGLHGSSDARKQAPYQQQQYTIDPYVPNEPSKPAVATLQLAAGGVQYLSSNNLRELPNSGSYDRRPALEYGIPDAPPSYAARRLKLQSNQRAYAPQRSESPTLAQHTIPYPPSFISITTSKPQFDDAAPTSYFTPAQAPSFKSHSQMLPIPDFFAQRSPKSLLDSYIPSWVIQEMLQQHRLHDKRNQLVAPYKRYFKRESSLLTQKNKSKAAHSLSKKSLQHAKGEEMVMTA